MPPAPLHGLRVLDLSTVLAGPNCARYLADFGADVIKVERPDGGDSLRNMAWRDPRDGEGLWWKLVNRNKRTIVIDLKSAADLDVLRSLVVDANVLIENFRPGTLERLGLGPDVLLGLNPALVITRVTGFGQTGPYRNRPGFATIAEAMSGLAAISGEPDGQPLLPPIALTDEVTGVVAAFATMVALRSGVGQVVDVSLLESLFQLMGPLISLYELTGQMQERLGSGLPYSVPRGTYQCQDGGWVGVSTSSDSVAVRVLNLLGVGGDPRFTTFAARMENRLALEAVMTAWCAERTQAEVMEAFTAAEAAIGPVMSMADIAADPHYAARQAIADVDGTPMQGLIAHLSATPGVLRWQGRALDADGDDVRANGWGEARGEARATAPRAYIAGPLFDEGERWWIERVEGTVVAAGFTTFLPHRDNPPKDEHNVAEIFANDRRGIDACDVVVASLNGVITDDGTAWELGYAFALGKPIIGLHTDWRRRFDHEVINLMIECSLTLLVRSLDELPGVLRTMFETATPTRTIRSGS